jgi:TetR/AcrR family transcriptional regulator
MEHPIGNGEPADRVLQAAVHLFATKGLAATSVREIVEAAGTTKPTLYYHFGSKEGICRAAFARVADLMISRVSAALDVPADPASQLVEFVWALFCARREYPELARLVTSLLFGPEAEVPGLVVRDLVDTISHCFAQAAERACASGVARPGCEARLAAGLRGATTAWIQTPNQKEEPELTHALAEQIVSDLLCGFAAEGARGRCPG